MHSNNVLVSILRAFHAVFVEMPVALWGMLGSVGDTIAVMCGSVLATVNCAFVTFAAEVACTTNTAVTAVFAAADTYLPSTDFASLASWVGVA